MRCILRFFAVHFSLLILIRPRNKSKTLLTTSRCNQSAPSAIWMDWTQSNRPFQCPSTRPSCTRDKWMPNQRRRRPRATKFCASDKRNQSEKWLWLIWFWCQRDSMSVLTSSKLSNAQAPVVPRVAQTYETKNRRREKNSNDCVIHSIGFLVKLHNMELSRENQFQSVFSVLNSTRFNCQ